MMEEWTPITLASISVAILMVPAALVVFSIVLSIVITYLNKNCLNNSSSGLVITLDKIGAEINYLAFIGVILMNFAAAGLLISGIWAILNFIVDMFSFI